MEMFHGYEKYIALLKEHPCGEILTCDDITTLLNKIRLSHFEIGPSVFLRHVVEDHFNTPEMAYTIFEAVKKGIIPEYEETHQGLFADHYSLPYFSEGGFRFYDYLLYFYECYQPVYYAKKIYDTSKLESHDIEILHGSTAAFALLHYVLSRCTPENAASFFKEIEYRIEVWIALDLVNNELIERRSPVYLEKLFPLYIKDVYNYELILSDKPVVYVIPERFACMLR